MVGAIGIILGFDPGGTRKRGDQGKDGIGKFGWITSGGSHAFANKKRRFSL